MKKITKEEYYLKVIGIFWDWAIEWDKWDKGTIRKMPVSAQKMAKDLVKLEKKYFK